MTIKDGSADSHYLPDIIPPGTRVTVRVPASSANLGPGFDSLGLALAHYDEIEVTRTGTDLTFDIAGEGADSVPRSAEHLLVKAMRAVWQVVGASGLPGLHLKARNRIPHSRGMGSSAATIVAGACAANALLPAWARINDAAILRICAGMEGHPDNVAPSLYGNLVISYGEHGDWRCLPIPVHPDILPLVAVPDYEVSTGVARKLLPETVPHRDAAVNSGRAALLTQALSTYPDHLLAGTADMLTQPYRAAAMQPSAAMVAQLRGLGYPAVISGAGPTVLVFTRGHEERAQAGAAIERCANQPDTGVYRGRCLNWRVLPVDIDTEGVMIRREENTAE